MTIKKYKLILCSKINSFCDGVLTFCFVQGEEEPRGVRPAAKITIDKADPKVITIIMYIGSKAL